MNCREQNVRVFVPITEVWLSSMIGPNQFVQVSFYNKPTKRDIDVLMKLLRLARSGAMDTAPQTPEMASPGPVEGSAEPVKEQP